MITKEQLIEILKKHKLPEFRGKQIMHAVYEKGILAFPEMTTLPPAARVALEKEIGILSISAEKVLKSKDSKTDKILFRLHDGKNIESVLMRFRDGRNSVCVSSQVGCRLGCRFCATGAFGFNRDLTWEEIADQVLFCSSLLAKERERISNVIYMGMGEPFMNYDNVLKSVRILNDKDCMNIGARNITVSTSGICEGIEKLANEKLQINLAVSLHAPNQAVRESIMPVAKMYPLDRLMDSIRKYLASTNRRVTYEYIMLKGVNDRLSHAKELATLLKGQLCHINLIPYNDTGLSGMTGSGRNMIATFSEVLRKSGLPVTVRVSLGQDIEAACGQLANKTKSIKS